MALPRQARYSHAIKVRRQSKAYRKATSRTPRVKHGRRLQYSRPIQFDPNDEYDSLLIELYDLTPHLVPDVHAKREGMLLLENINVTRDPVGLHKDVYEPA